MLVKKMLFILVFLGGILFCNAVAGSDTPVDTSDFENFLKSFDLTREEFQARVGSTKLFGGSSPVSFSGEGRVKAQYHLLESDQYWMDPDRSYIQSGWEGNESMIRLGMVARAGRNTVLYSKIGFQNTFPGIRWKNEKSATDGTAQAQTPHDKSLVTANIHEDMSAGIAIRTVPASFWLRMGNVNWVEASPFTVWKAQPRTFAWEFLPFEIEQPISRYYEYNIAKGEKAGRAAWHKKPFNGICLESINLPRGLYFDMLYGTFERYDNFEREYLDVAGDRTYTEPFPLKGSGIGDSYRHIFHARLASTNVFGDMTLALNFNRINYSDDIFTIKDQNTNRFLTVFDIDGSLTKPLTLNGTGFYKEPMIFSVDLRGKTVGGLIDMHSDVGVSKIDTTFMTWTGTDIDSSARYSKTSSVSAVSPALYSRVNVNTRLPFQADIAIIGKGFYSPFSFVAPNDAFYAFGSNLLGSGKFLARHEASPYVQNMAGVLLSATPKLSGYGHFKVSYGQHFQLEAGRDILYIPYRLNGLDFFSLFHSSYDRWGSGPLSLSTLSEMDEAAQTTSMFRGRLGDESYISSSHLAPRGMEGGGLYNDFLSSMECFVPYDNVEDAIRNKRSADLQKKGGKSWEVQGTDISYNRFYVDSTGDTILSETGFVPISRKFTNNFELDIAYDISDMIGYPNNFFIGGYMALNNVTTSFSPLATGSNGEDVQLWSVYVRIEPAIALTKKFYLLGIFGFENWQSKKSWMYMGEDDSALVTDYLSAEDYANYIANDHECYVKVPIDYRDLAFGLGFDWEMLNRVGLHGRVKYMSHKDINFIKNNWSTPVVSLEIKTWF